MTTNKYAFDTGTCCSPQWVGDRDYQSDGGPCSDKRKILLNPPPQSGECDICGRHVRNLDPYGGPGDPLIGDFSGAKLVKSFREEFPGQIGSSWECRECIARSGTLWEIEEEDRLGRPLTEKECEELRKSRLTFYEYLSPAEDS